MIIYKRLTPIKAISFDLDDTLYENHPQMLACYQQMLTFFKQHLGGDRVYDHAFWIPFRNQAVVENERIRHDVGKLRLQSYYLGIQSLGYDKNEALKLAEQAMAHFLFWRSNFTVPQESIELLETLKKKYPIVAITNGNVDAEKIGIARYFDAIFHANEQYALKPAPDMFAAACQQLNITPNQLLHVGDCGRSDIFGAARYGCQTAYFNRYGIGKPLKILPNIALTKVSELANLVR
ncbi:HAD-IA family hydrolase [Thalassotalea agarivorans]|uniref:Putative hydrolase of the HAD superfamily n=1 Tax=Thalassotalea agarivorans TaxID=349064 RepID=A0A1I0CJF1_THASX|nr:HAD-IA family hydrolase [Thalassotalea agarivorans]SET19540.1 putative hydrolase of the HAD superfamily [Thalassotalea agarivorans]